MVGIEDQIVNLNQLPGFYPVWSKTSGLQGGENSFSQMVEFFLFLLILVQ